MIDSSVTLPLHEAFGPTDAGGRNAHRTAGRWIGAAMLVSFAAGMFSNFQLQRELFAAPGFLVQAAGQPLAIGAMVVLGIVTGMLSLAVASLLHRVYGHVRPVLTLFLVALVSAGLAINVLEGATLLGMRSLSEAYLAAGAGADAAFEPARQVLRGLRNGIHFPNKMLGGFGVLLVFTLLLRQRALPRWLAGFGMLAAGMQVLTIMQELFGRDVNLLLLAPLALAYPGSALWLLARGLAPAAESRAAG
jgi:hypothetical protein